MREHMIEYAIQSAKRNPGLLDEIVAHMNAGCADCERANAAVGRDADPRAVLEMRCLYGASLQRRAAWTWGEEEL